MLLLSLLLLAPLSYILYLLLNLLHSILIPKPLPFIPRLGRTQWFFGDVRPLFKSFEETGQFHSYFEKASIKLGPIYQFFWPLSLGKPTLVVSDPEAVEKILKDTASFDRAPATLEVFATVAPFGALSLPAGKMWRHHRILFGPAMSFKNLRRVTPNMVFHIRTLLILWETKRSIVSSTSITTSTSPPFKSDCFEVNQDLAFTAQDIISDLAFGESYHSLRGTLEEVKLVGRKDDGGFPNRMSKLAVASKRYFEAIPAEDLSPSISWILKKAFSPSLRAAERTIRSFIDAKIVDGRRRIRGGDAGLSLLDVVLEKEFKEESEGRGLLKLAEVRDELLTFLVAGEETTAATMAWMLRYLAQNPEVQRKLRTELLRSLPDLSEREISFEDMHETSTPYLDAVLHECLRVGKTVCAVYRQTLKEVEIYGHVVPKGHDILCLIGRVGMCTEGGEKAAGSGAWERERVNEFRPERWIDSDGNFNPKAGPSTPFATGQRGCYGIRLAILELKLFLALLNQDFFLEQVPDELADVEEIKVNETITRRPRETWVRVRRWEDVQ